MIRSAVSVSELLEKLERTLSGLGHRLRLKYGLGQNATPDQIQRWHRLTQNYIYTGIDSEQAGRKAAEVIFIDFGQYGYMSEAETIAQLLDAVKDKSNQ